VRPTSAVSRWSMDSSDVDSGVIKDSWGGNDGSLNGGVTTGVSGVGGGEAFSFDGSNDYLEIPTSLGFGTGSFTVSMWIKKSTSVNDRGSVTWDEVPLWMQRSNGSQSFLLYMDEVENGKIGAGLRDKNNNLLGTVSTDTEVNNGVWNHISVSREESSKLRLYVNGSESFSFDSTGDIGTINQVIVGSIVNGSGDHNRNYKGSIDELRIYNSALSQQQIWKLYNIGRNANWGLSRS